jgi:lipoate-protein ligase A
MSGFEAVLRLAGGRAAVFHPRTLAFSWTIPDPSPRSGIAERFQLLAQVVRDALKDLGVDARIGEVPGEYCPGDYSVNARGRTKLMGVGQRLDQAAAHVGGVIVIGDARRVRDVLVPVYEALELAWDPSTAGSIEEEVGDTAYTRVEAALLEQFSRLAAIEEGRLSPGVLDLAYAMERDVRVV